tara:strand:- start:1795 stop:3327 length:1533 start_codon:yes stop_codon:yes gene_type:complete
MKLKEISKPQTTASLNESLAKTFGQRINVDAFTLEQLQDARNKIRTELSQIETNESFDSVLKDSDYQKKKMFLDVLNSAVADRESISEDNEADEDNKMSTVNEKGAKPDYLDFDKDGDKKEPMKKALKDKKKKGPVKEGDGIYHDCAKSFKHPKLGECECIPGQHTLLEDGTVTHYDVKFKKDGKLYIAKNVPIAEATDIVSEGHKHASKKTKSRKMKEGMGEDVFREIEGINDVYDELEQLNREKMGGGISEQLDNMRQHIEGMYKVLDKHKSENMTTRNISKMDEGKNPTKAHVMKMVKDGKSEKEMMDMHSDADKDKLKAMIKDCKKEMKENKDQGKVIIENYFKSLIEGEEDKAEIVMAAKDMVDRITSWMEDTAEMQAESMLELGDAIRDELGVSQSESYIQTVKPSLESLYAALEVTRGALTSGVAKLTGEEDPAQMMGDEAGAEPAMDADMEPSMDAEEPAAPADDFDASEPAAGGEDEAGRAKRESIELSLKLGQILSSKKK